MNFSLDARVPVVIAMQDIAGPNDALLLEVAESPLPSHAAACFQVDTLHPPGCTCCAPRRAAGRALAALLQARARGTTHFFTRVVAVVATEAGRQEVISALRTDPVAASCFRLAE